MSYPVILQLEDKIALVVGGGKVAQRKVETLLSCGASIHIISRVLTDKLKDMIDGNEVRLLGEEMREEFLDDVFIVIAATDDKELNSRVSEMARNRGLLVNAVDQPADCNFIVPSIVRKGDLLIAISTSGKSPAMAKRIRKEIDGQFGNEYESFLNLMGRLRKEILGMGLSQQENGRIFNEIVYGGIIEAIAQNDLAKVESSLERILPQEINIRTLLSHAKPQRAPRQNE
jgi:precorrin-2 dehydrogenase/sirohydrochlorin ferrochelatase